MSKRSGPDEEIAALRKKGYDDAAIARYAVAERSWCERSTAQWELWREVERLMTVPSTGGKKEA